MPITISLIAPPLYVMTTTALQDAESVAMLNRAIEKLSETIKEYGGNLVMKTAPRVAQKQEDADLEGLMKRMELENQEVAADDDEDDE